jgi:hypothetical protein
LAIALAVVVLALIVAGAGWWVLTSRESAPDWGEGLPALDFVAPAGDAFAEDVPWVRLLLAPARPGENNTLTLALAAPQGTPVPANAAASGIAALSARPLAGDPGAETLTLSPNDDGTLTATSALDRAGWWRLSVAFDGRDETADFYLLLPDPNVNGPGAVSNEESTAEGEALFQRGIDGVHALRSVVYTQWLGDGIGNASFSEHAVRAGDEGTPPAFAFRASGGMDAIVIDDTRWIRLPGDLGWTRQEGAVVIPPAKWGEEYQGATGFTILGEETIDGEPSQILAFVVPEVTEPRRQTAAWYLWWVGAETGHLRREAMVSRQHYMLNQFTDFDVPLDIVPPEDDATPPVGTPAA